MQEWTVVIMHRVKCRRPTAGRHVLARDIAIAVAVKAALLAGLFALFARAALHPANDAAATAAAVAGTGRSGAISR